MMRETLNKMMRIFTLTMIAMLATALSSLPALAQETTETAKKKQVVPQMVQAKAETSQMLPPANDNFTGAQSIFGPAITTNGTNLDATKEAGEPLHAEREGGKSVWFTWTASGTGAVTLTTLGSNFDTVLAVYTGNGVNALTHIAANDDGAPDNTSRVVFGALSGTTYRIAIDGYSASSGNITLNLTLNASPTNDNFANAEVISGGENLLGTTGTNFGSTKEAGEPTPLIGGNRTVWYRWTAPATRSYTFRIHNLFEGNGPPQILVFTGASVNALTFVKGNFSYGNERYTSVSFPAVGGTIYRIQVNGVDGPGGVTSTGNFSLLWSITRNRLTFDGGDGVTDFTIYRPSQGAWHVLSNHYSSAIYSYSWGASTDKPVPADYDGDGVADRAVYRPSNGGWYIHSSMDNSTRGVAFGNVTDRPVPGDYDGDGKADIAVFRQSEGAWYILRSVDGTLASYAFGQIGDVPVPGYYDSDNRLDVAVFRPSTGTWYLLRTSGGFTSAQWGNGSDKPVAADYDGDGRTDIAIFRPSDGYWHIYNLVNQNITSIQWGAPFADTPVVGDYDGDGKMDVAVYRQSTHSFYARQSSNLSLLAVQWGTGDDVPVTSAYVPE